MIKLDDICFSYSDALVLNKISAQFEKGRFYAIVGPNGCGKTTLLEIISRLKKPDKGTILIGKKESPEYSKKEFAKTVAYLPQGSTPPDMTVYDYVSYGRFPYMNISRRLTTNDRMQIGAALKITNTEAFSHRNIRELSGGERQRVYIAMLLSQNSPFILLDEPTTYLDISNQFAMMDMLRSIVKEGKCIIAVIHELTLALRFCDVILLMNNGKNKCMNTPDTIVKKGLINDVFNVDCKEIIVNGKKEYIII